MNIKYLLLTLLLIFTVACSADDHAGHDMSGSGDNHSGDDMGDEGDGMSAMDMGMDVPEGLDIATNKMSDGGMFQVSVAPLVDEVEINELHSWELTLMDMDMNPVEGATIAFGGGMPEHDHGFPTEPEVVAGDEAGTYVIEGVKMQMAGWWEMKLDISAESMTDTVTFNIVLP